MILIFILGIFTGVLGLFLFASIMTKLEDRDMLKIEEKSLVTYKDRKKVYGQLGWIMDN
jgi:hypothetical protein